MVAPEEIAVAKIQCLKSTLFFTRFFFKEFYGRKFVVGEHHKSMAKKIDEIFEGKCKRLIINIAPRYTKTEMAVKMLIAKGLGINPKSKFIHMTYSNALALDNSERAKEIVKSDTYKQMFPSVRIKKETDSKQKWYTTEGGGVYATAAGGQVTGFGAGLVDDEDAEKTDIEELNAWLAEMEKFGGAIIIDDPLKPEDAVYPVKRQKVNDRYDSTIQNRVNSRNTPIIVIMQRIHTEDLCGHLQAHYPGWDVLSLPVIKEDGQPLWPFKHTLAELEILKEANDFIFETQMMQNPLPSEGLLFHKKHLKYFKLPELNMESVESRLAYTDVADGGGDNLCTVVGLIMPGKVFIVDVIYSQEDVGVTVPKVIDMIEKWKLPYMRVERNNQGGGFIRDIERVVGDEVIYPVTNLSNKETRIWNEAGFIKKHFIFREDYEKRSDYDKFMNALWGYLKGITGQVDDGPDATAGLATFIQSFVAELFPVKKSIK